MKAGYFALDAMTGVGFAFAAWGRYSGVAFCLGFLLARIETRLMEINR